MINGLQITITISDSKLLAKCPTLALMVEGDSLNEVMDGMTGRVCDRLLEMVTSGEASKDDPLVKAVFGYDVEESIYGWRLQQDLKQTCFKRKSEGYRFC